MKREKTPKTKPKYVEAQMRADIRGLCERIFDGVVGTEHSKATIRKLRAAFVTIMSTELEQCVTLTIKRIDAVYLGLIEEANRTKKSAIKKHKTT